MKGKNKSLITMIVVAVVVGAAGFFGGMQYQKSQTPTIDAMIGNGTGSGGQRMMMRNGQNATATQGNRPVSGEIISQDDKSITVKMEDGSTKIIILSDGTTINKSSTGTAADLKTGEKVTVFGSANSDGSVTAQMVSLGSTMFRTTMPAGGMPNGGGMRGNDQPVQGGQTGPGSQN